MHHPDKRFTRWRSVYRRRSYRPFVSSSSALEIRLRVRHETFFAALRTEIIELSAPVSSLKLASCFWIDAYTWDERSKPRRPTSALNESNEAGNGTAPRKF